MTKLSPSDQRRLLELQAVDTAIRRLAHRRAHLPEQQQLDERSSLLDRVTADHLAASDELVAVDRRQRKLEQEIGVVDTRRRSEEGRMYSGVITSERELTALRQELSTLKGRKRDLEDELLEVMERHEELTGTIAALDVRRTELQAEVAPLEKARDVAASDIDDEFAARQGERAEVVAQLPDDLVARYEQLRARKDGLAVAELAGGVCSGCHLELTPGELEEGREMGVHGLARCVQCGRILVESTGG